MNSDRLGRCARVDEMQLRCAVFASEAANRSQRSIIEVLEKVKADRRELQARAEKAEAELLSLRAHVTAIARAHAEIMGGHAGEDMDLTYNVEIERHLKRALEGH